MIAEKDKDAMELEEKVQLPFPLSWRRPMLIGVKAVHSLIYFSIEWCMGYVIYAGIRRQEDKRAAIAAGVVAGECLIFLGNQWRCPLTGLAQRLGDADGSVTDIYLPRWLASNLVWIHIPLLVLALWLHARNLAPAVLANIHKNMYNRR